MNLTEFYPTPQPLIDKMLSGIDFRKIDSVLEPSAGKCDLCEGVAFKFRAANHRYGIDDNCADIIDTIEIDENLRHIIKGKGYRVVHNDFLTFHSRKRYGLIVMNPPFSEGDKHLTKALDLQQYGGWVVCVLNAETLRNPYSNLRKTLVRRLNELDADIEYLTGTFESAERTTNVEIALVKVNIPDTLPDSLILDGLKRAQEEREDVRDPDAVTHNDFVQAIVQRYRFEVDAGVRLIREWRALQPYIQNSIKGENKMPLLELKLRGSDSGDLVNGYIRQVRLKYWNTLFREHEFIRGLTSNLQEQLYSRVSEFGDYEFSEVNICTLQMELSMETVRAIEETILALFDKFSDKHSWCDETSKNIHYYNGWKTNKAWKINKKVIVPFYGNIEFNRCQVLYRHGVRREMADIAKVFDYLSGTEPLAPYVERWFEQAQSSGISKNVQLGHFSVTFYKKGTAHITFLNQHLLDKFNIFGSQRKGWLPPSYGKKLYLDMSAEERAVIDEFEGAESYAKVVANPEAYIIETNDLMLLGAGDAA